MEEKRLAMRESYYLGRFEPLPGSVIENIEVNHDLISNSQDPQLKKYLNPDYVISKAAHFAIGLKSITYGTNDERKPANPNAQKKVQAPGMHRGFIINYGSFYDEHGVSYGYIAVKGTGLSFRSVGSKAAVKTHDPLGFFGTRHARQDQMISDIFAEYGGRTSRGVVIIELNRKRFSDWYRGLNIINDKYDVEEMLEIVKTNGDTPALMVRLLGADREDEVIRPTRYQNPKTAVQERPFIYTPMLMRAFNLVKAEVARKGAGKFQDEYEIPHVVFGKLRRAEQSLEMDDINEALQYIQLHFFNWNKGIGNVLRVHEFDGDLHFNIHRGNYDLLGSWVDWENAVSESGQTLNGFEEPHRYVEYAIDKKHQELNGVMQNARLSAEYHAQRMIPGLISR